MKREDLNRRDFNRLTMAAFGGMLAGTTLGCSMKPEQPSEAGSEFSPVAPGSGAEEVDQAVAAAATDETGFWMAEVHVCRGLNACKGQGAGKDNDCAGQGTCATASEHTCHFQNDCKGQGGCGEHPGENACKEKGECGVPLGDGAWAKARESFEAAMKKAGKDVGVAPKEV